jgi:hypothetical protein
MSVSTVTVTINALLNRVQFATEKQLVAGSTEQHGRE